MNGYDWSWMQDLTDHFEPDEPDAEYIEPKPRIRASVNLNDLLEETYLLLKRGGKDV